MATSIPSLRPGRRSDLPTLVAIYNHYVANTPITFDLEATTVAARRKWIDGFGGSGPYRLLVAEVDNVVVGYASSMRFKERPAYNSSVETTIYLDANFAGKGIGQQLYSALLETLDKEPGVHRAYGIIALPNHRSVALHERLGFRLVGTCHEVGYKFGKYWDVGWFERNMSS